MKVAYIIPSLGASGPVIVVRNLVERMVAHGHECVVFYFDERPDAMRFACETRRISIWRRQDFSAFDLVHAHCFRPMLYAARLRNVKKMTTLHSYLFTEYRFSLGKPLGWLLGRFTMRVARKYDKVAVLSEDARAYYSHWIPSEKLRVCYNGVRIDTFLSTDSEQQRFAENQEIISRFKGSSTLIACICGLYPIKNIETMVRALALLPADYKLLLIGSGTSEKQLKRLAAENGLTDRMLFLGRHVEAHRYLPQVDIFAMTSLSEGFCLSLTEAAMYGKKIVCADIAGMREKYSEDAVAFFAPDDFQGLANAIVEVNAQPQKGLRAKETAEQRFTTENMYNAYQLIYNE